MVYLATTALDKFWDKTADEIVFLGEWCKTNSDLKDLQNYKTMSFLWSNQEIVKTAFNECWAVYYAILPILSKHLNEIHNINKSDRYWKIIIGNWLWCFIQIVYDRYKNINNFIAEYPNFNTFVLSKNSYITPLEYGDFINNISSDPYNLQLYSQILDYLGFNFKALDYNLNQRHVYKYSHKSLFKNTLFRFIEFFAKKDACITITTPNFINKMSFIKLFFNSNRKIIYDDFNDPIFIGIKKDITMRNNFTKLYNENNDFIKLLFYLFEQNFPMLFLEGFDDMRKNALSRSNRLTKVYFTTNAVYFNYPYKFFLAEHIEQILFVGMQHGGNYGSDNFCNAEKYERDISDYFLTWGWKYGRGTKSCTHEIINQNIKPKKDGYILFVMNDMLRYLYRIDPFYQSSAIKLTYLPKTISFFKNVKTIDKFLVRTYPSDSGFKIAQTLKDNFPNMIFDNHSKTFRKRLKDARLYVCDHLSTTYLEALAMNFPTVVFVDKNYFYFRKPELFELLIDAKILFYDEIEAAKHIDTIYNNIDDWWLSDKVQKARQEFCYNYARTSDDWAKEYMKVFSNILEENARN